MKGQHHKLIAVLYLVISIHGYAQDTIRIACIGASITAGATLTNPREQSFPAQLGRLLGKPYQVKNYGVGGCTLLKQGDHPYVQTEAYQDALNSRPNIVIIDLGGNDAKAINRIHKEDFIGDYTELIHSFRSLPTQPRIILLLPVPGFTQDTSQIWDPAILRDIIPRIQEVAWRQNTEVLNLHALMVDKGSWFEDQVHPNLAGTTAMAQRLAEAVSGPGANAVAPALYDIRKSLPDPYTQSNFYGYNCLDFSHQGRDCHIVQPKWTASGNPWVWRARFWGHEPQTDIALLERGYHIVYDDVAEWFGNAEAISHWDDFYALLQKAGLGPKAVMEGMSRGGVYVFNWAALHPDAVASVYVDNPVLDLKMWPGGLGARPASAPELAELLKDYGLSSQAALKNFKGSPIDKVPAIVKGGYPILILSADADEALNPAENALLFEKRVKALGGRITVMHKPGFKHHPHSLPNPTPIVNFVLEAARNPAYAAQRWPASQTSAQGLKGATGSTATQGAKSAPEVDAYDVTYTSPGPGSSASMPLGNGDLGLNVWVDNDGTLSFYISKTDAWGGQVKSDWDPWMKRGGVLMKLGAVHLRCVGVEAGPVFSQTLHLSQGVIWIHEGQGTDTALLKVWVDANQPVIRVEVKSGKPVKVEATLDDWRLNDGDRLRPAETNAITWYHKNPGKSDTTLIDPHLADITFGAMIKGDNLEHKDSLTLETKQPRTGQLVSIYALTEKVAGVQSWNQDLLRLAAKVDQHPLTNAWKEHQLWWSAFWNRSWINVYGSKEAEDVTRGYILQRFITACAGRGAYPIKFNGSIFVVDNPDWQGKQHNADFRAWGGMFWFQNTRPMYWSRLMAGDFDLMMPLFRMYKNMLPGNQAQVKQYYGHGGAYFQETTPFWGGIPFMGPQVQALYTNHYFTPILELSMMMLDYVDYTQDSNFAKRYLIPIATAGLTFYAEHFGRDSAGKLLLDPDNSIEMFWKVHDPAPDLAALHAVIPRMLALPASWIAGQRKAWKDLLAILPPLPEGAGKLLPYTGPQTAQAHNLENPELYAIYPYRLFGVGKPDMDIALKTFEARKFKEKGCWNQDPIQAAFLGLDSVAREYVHYNFTRKDPNLVFPAFWAVGHDYLPDEDNGGNGEYALQHMLLQADGTTIWLLPAWPRDWNADFKLHAPMHTTIEGRVEGGKITRLVVTPATRASDVRIIM